LCAVCINKMLKITFEQSHSSIFRALYHGMVHAVFQPAVFWAKPGSDLYAALKNAFDVIITNSHVKLHLLKEVLNRCKDHWTPFSQSSPVVTLEIQYPADFVLSRAVAINCVAIESPCLISACDHIEFFLHCLTYVPPTTKDIKSLEQISKYSGLVDNVLSVGECYELTFSP